MSEGPSGGCACGGVRYRLDAPPRAGVNCHCEPCRRITGHFMAATAALFGDEASDYHRLDPSIETFPGDHRLGTGNG